MPDYGEIARGLSARELAARLRQHGPTPNPGYEETGGVLRWTADLEEAARRIEAADNTDSVKLDDGYRTIHGVRVYGPALDAAPVPVTCPGHGDDEDCEDDAANPCKACYLYDDTVGRSHWPEYDEAPTATCQHCGRTVTYVNGRWVDTNATGDDVMWRETCDTHDTFTAEHEPMPGQIAGDTPEPDSTPTDSVESDADQRQAMDIVETTEHLYDIARTCDAERLEEALRSDVGGVAPWPGHTLDLDKVDYDALAEHFRVDEENTRITAESRRGMTPNWVYPLFATCAVCGEQLQFDVDPNGTPGQNGDWGADGDYGCFGDPADPDEGTFGHTPEDIEWRVDDDEKDAARARYEEMT